VSALVELDISTHTFARIQLFCVQLCKKSCSYLAQPFLQTCTLCKFTIVQRFCGVCKVARRLVCWRVFFLVCTPIYGHYYTTLALHSFIISKWKLVERHRELAFSMLLIFYVKPMKGHYPFIIYENVEQEKENFSHVQLH
jgi:hypothetical protein